MNTDVAVLENENVVVEAKVKKPRVRKPKNFVSPEPELQDIEIEATEPVTLEEMFAAELSTGDATDKVNQLFADKPEEEVVEVEEKASKAPKAPKQRATKEKAPKQPKEKAPKVQKAPKQREKIVRVAPEGYMWFGDVARLLDVRYQQVFQRFSSGRLSGMLYEGHWCAAAGSVNEWIESRARYFARKGA